MFLKKSELIVIPKILPGNFQQNLWKKLLLLLFKQS